MKILKLDEIKHFFIIPVIIGIIGGFSAFLFRDFIKFFTSVYNDLNLFHSNLFYLISTPLIFLFSYYVIKNFPINPNNVSIDEITKKISLAMGHFSPLKGLIVLFLTSLSLGFGVPVGREGPIAKLGGVGTEIFIKLIKIPRVDIPIYLSAGISSAIAATFNAPLAGIIFGIEIIIGKINSYILIPLIVSTFTATLISREFIGNFAAFYVPHLNYSHSYLFLSPFEALFFGFLAIGFLKSVIHLKHLKEKSKRWDKTILIFGFIVGLLIVIRPEIRGVGYEFVEEIFQNKTTFFSALIIMLFKYIGTILSIGSGLFGGILSPSIFIGAFGGYFFGSFFHFLGLDPRVFALIGTAAMLSGVTKSPLRSSVIIIELTHSYQFILPILITSAITNYLISMMEPGSYFKRALLQRGIDIDDENLINFFTVDNLKKYILNTKPLKEDDDLKTVKERFHFTCVPYLPVTNNENELIGIVSLRDIKKHKFINKDKIHAKDIMAKNPFAINPNSSKKDIFKALSVLNSNYIPYTDENNKYKGMIDLNQFLRDISLKA